MKKILIVFTGGTICSFPSGADGKSRSDAKKMSSLLEERFASSDSYCREEVAFSHKFLKQDILSENMTVGTWSELLAVFRDEALGKGEYDGVIVLHGTDTLAYTASFLSIALAGLSVPVLLVSAQLNLQSEKTNGYENFRAAVELIAGGIAPNVYAVYRNLLDSRHTKGPLLLHYGAHLLQSPNHSNNFHSYDEITLSASPCVRHRGRRFEGAPRYFEKIDAVSGGVLLLQPYTGLRYSDISLEGVRAIVHGTYHSESVCIGRAADPDAEKDRDLSLSEVLEADRPYSILTLLEKCEKKGIPLFLAPCNEESFTYGTTANALHKGAGAIADMTLEAAYAKAVVGVSLGLSGKDLAEFLSASVNHELVYKDREKDL